MMDMFSRGRQILNASSRKPKGDTVGDTIYGKIDIALTALNL